MESFNLKSDRENNREFQKKLEKLISWMALVDLCYQQKTGHQQKTEKGKDI